MSEQEDVDATNLSSSADLRSNELGQADIKERASLRRINKGVRPESKTSERGVSIVSRKKKKKGEKPSSQVDDRELSLDVTILPSRDSLSLLAGVALKGSSSVEEAVEQGPEGENEGERSRK